MIKRNFHSDCKHNRTQLIKSIRLDELYAFTIEQISGSRLLGGGFLLMNGISLGLLIAGIFLNAADGWTEFFYFGIDVLIGIALFIAIIPIHELIHFLVYKCSGAKHVKIKVLKNMVFQTEALDFVASKRSMMINTVTPFFLISVTIFMIWYFGIIGSNTITLTALLLHTQPCFGDFVIFNYLSKLPGKVFIVDNSKTNNMEIFRYIEE